jgi:hypothetical protein
MDWKHVFSDDNRLSYQKKLDGGGVIVRRSPFNAQRSFEVFDTKNLFLGSRRWVRDRLAKMDSQRQNIVYRVRENNLRIRRQKSDRRVHRELADLIHGGGDTFIN